MAKALNQNVGSASASWAELPAALLSTFEINNRINQYLIENLPAEAWTAKPPEGKGRTISAIVAHMHNVRVMWLKAAAKGSEIPEQLDRAAVTPAQALKAMNASGSALVELLGRAAKSDGRIKGFRPDVAAFFGYLIARCASSRANHHAGSPGWPSHFTKSDVWYVGVGFALKR